MAAGTSAIAQEYPGDIHSVTYSGTLWKVQRSGQATSLADLGFPAFGLTMAPDNRGIFWTGHGSERGEDWYPATINLWTGTNNITLFSSTTWFIYDITMNQDGNLVFTGGKRGNPPIHGLFKWHGGNLITTIVTAQQLGTTASLNGGLEINVKTGNYLLPNGAYAFPAQIWDVADDGSFTSLITSAPNPAAVGSYSIAQDRANGYIYQSGFSNYKWIDRSGNQTIMQAGGNANSFYYALRVDRASTPHDRRKLWVMHQSTNFQTDYIHVVSDPYTNPSYTSTVINSRAPTGTSYEMIFEGERNLASTKKGPGAYDININFPGEANNLYVMAMSFAGFWPATQTPDGRNVCLNFDWASVYSIQNALRPMLNTGPGVLDANGNATATLRIGEDNLGLTAHFVVMTFDVQNNIASISDPYVIKL